MYHQNQIHATKETDQESGLREILPGENRGHGEDDAGGDGGEDADAARRVQVAGVEHEDPGQEEELRGEEGGQPRIASIPRTLKLGEDRDQNEEWVAWCPTKHFIRRSETTMTSYDKSSECFFQAIES